MTISCVIILLKKPEHKLQIRWYRDYIERQIKPPESGNVKLELRIQIHEFRVQIHELRIQIYELRVQIHELQVSIHELEDEKYKLQD